MKKKFAWGRVITRHVVGPYEIVEYAVRADNHPTHPRQETGAIAFHPYINGEDSCQGYDSLDAALAGAIAYRNEGCNHRADIYFIKAIQ